MANNDLPQNHAQPGERGQGGEGIEPDITGNVIPQPAPAGGVGGQSGTGQATPHHGQQNPQGSAALNPPAERTEPPASGNGPTYQSGGTQQDREQRDAERKANEGTAPSPTNSSGAADPAPGKQGGQNP